MKQEKIAALFESVKMTTSYFEKEIDRMESHSKSHGDPLDLDEFHRFYNTGQSEDL